MKPFYFGNVCGSFVVSFLPEREIVNILSTKLQFLPTCFLNLSNYGALHFYLDLSGPLLS